MGIMLYKGGDETIVRGVKCIAKRFNARDLQNRLDEGWFVDPSDLYKVATILSFEEADTNDTGLLSNKEVRQAAKTAGLDDWQTARIATLKEELGYAQS